MKLSSDLEFPPKMIRYSRKLRLDEFTRKKSNLLHVFFKMNSNLQASERLLQTLDFFAKSEVAPGGRRRQDDEDPK